MLEIAASGLNLLYIIFLIREKIICWPLGIAGSFLSVLLFVQSGLYSEALLYSYYIAMGAWGWIHWHQRNSAGANPVLRYSLVNHAAMVIAACAAAILLGSFFAEFTQAQRPYVDALTTSFSFAATYMQVKKVLDNWIYWIIVNLATIWLYQDRQLDIYAALMVIYFILSVTGFVQWLRVYRGQRSEALSLIESP